MAKKSITRPRPTLSRAKSRPTRRTQLSITIDPALLPALDARGENRSETIRVDLSRYYRLLAEARTRLREILTPAELAAIIDVQNGHWYHERLDPVEIWANVEGGCRLEGLDTRHKIDGPALVEKLQSLDLLQVHALADATVRFWHAVGEGDAFRDPRKALD